MNIGIIVYSQTGNTLSVAQKLKDKLSAAGHTAAVEQVITEGEPKPGDKNIKLKTCPGVEAYDAVVFGGQVQAFSLSVVMKAYLAQLTSLDGKTIACFVTKGLLFCWTGGNRAIRQMINLCASKDGSVCETGIVVWSGKKKREERIARAVDKLSGIF